MVQVHVFITILTSLFGQVAHTGIVNTIGAWHRRDSQLETEGMRGY